MEHRETLEKVLARAALILMLALCGLDSGQAAAASRIVTKDVRDAAQALDTTTRRIVAAQGVVRKNGFVYGMDVAWLMLYAAAQHDRGLYESLRPEADQLVLDDGADPYTRGFVLWRTRAGTDREVSGASEAVAIARALFTGARVFGRDTDRTLAAHVLEGYRKLFFEKSGHWIIRRYFNFGTRSFAEISMLASYSPDFLRDVSPMLPQVQWPGPVDRAYSILDVATAANGLLNPVIVPEISQTWPELTINAFAPNGVVPLEDSCLAAEGAVRGRPKLAKNVLKFAQSSKRKNFLGRLFAHFRADTGKRVGETLLAPTGYACLVRLAAAVRDDDALEDLMRQFTADLELIAGEPNLNPAPLAAAGPLLVAAQAIGALPARFAPMAPVTTTAAAATDSAGSGD